MKFLSHFKLISLLLAIIAISMIFPLIVAFVLHEQQAAMAFLYPMVFCIVLGIIVLCTTRKLKIQLSIKSAFVAVAACWVFASILGAFPLYLSGCFASVTDAFFESVSGFSTTGSTILSEVESLPRSINLWRVEMHWLGGMGIVALTVALMPLIGIGGFQLIKAETTGPEKGKITPKITETAKILWFIYMGFTVVEAILLMVFGKMDFLDAVSHAFATLGTGGFSTRNASIGSYNSAAIDWIVTVFMFLSGINFSLYFSLLTKHGEEMLENSELKAYIGIFLVACLIVVLAIMPQYGLAKALRYGCFQVASIMSTTGFATNDYSLWPPIAQLVIFMLLFIGGSSGSTSGGFKVVRWVIFRKQLGNEIKRMLHPHGVFSIQLNGRAGRKDIIYNVSSFMFLYFCLVFVTMAVACIAGTDILTAFTTGLTLVGNYGPGFGKIAPAFNFGFFPAYAKWFFCFAMIAGRLELYTMIMFLLPSFWKGK